MSSSSSNIKEEHITLLKKQAELVQQLREVVASQQRALEQLGTVDEDYENAPERVAAVTDVTVGGELPVLLKNAESAAKRMRRDTAPTSEEAANPTAHIEWNATATTAKPWIAAIAPPSEWSWEESAARDAAPGTTLVLEHLFGYGARGSRGDAYWVDETKVVYFAGAVGILLNTATQTQRLFRGHDAAISALHFNRTRRIVASGQLGANAKVCIWSVDATGTAEATFGCHQRGVAAVAISPDGYRVASVGLDDEHTIVIHDINDKRKVAQAIGDAANAILAVGWNATSAADSTSELVTVGVNHLTFWSVSGGALTAKRALLGRKGEQQTFISVAFTADHTVVGTENGELYLFESNRLKRVVAAHSGAIASLCSISAYDRLVTGGSDGFVKVWDRTSFKALATLDLNGEDSSAGLNSVKSVSIDAAHVDTILVGTATSTLYSVPVDGETKPKVLTTGHFADKQTSVAAHPSTSRFATGGADGTVRVWGMEDRSQISRIEAGEPVTSVAYANNGAVLAVGLANGTFALYNTKNNFLISRTRLSPTAAVRALAFAPNDAMLAAASDDGSVAIYAVDGEELTIKVAGPRLGGAVTSIDFSADGKYVQVSTAADDLAFIDTESGARVAEPHTLNNVKWATGTSRFGWGVQGIWNGSATGGADVAAVTVSRSHQYVASAEDSGAVRVFNYPCVGSGIDAAGKLARRPQSIDSVAHGSGVARTAFASDDSRLISIGDTDNVVAQWRFF